MTGARRVVVARGVVGARHLGQPPTGNQEQLGKVRNRYISGRPNALPAGKCILSLITQNIVRLSRD
jgi:hypothetical protein